MSLLTVDSDELGRLGSKENPHPITPNKTKDRTPGHYYMFKDKLRCWGNGVWVRDKERRRVREKINKVIYDKVRIVQGCKNPETWTSLSQVSVPKPFRLGSLWYCKSDMKYLKKVCVYEIVDARDQQKEVWIEYGYKNNDIFLENRTMGMGHISMSIYRFIENYIPYTGSYDYYSEYNQ